MELVERVEKLPLKLILPEFLILALHGPASGLGGLLDPSEPRHSVHVRRPPSARHRRGWL
jgi:hypothetical protein